MPVDFFHQIQALRTLTSCPLVCVYVQNCFRVQFHHPLLPKSYLATLVLIYSNPIKIQKSLTFPVIMCIVVVVVLVFFTLICFFLPASAEKIHKLTATRKITRDCVMVKMPRRSWLKLNIN